MAIRRSIPTTLILISIFFVSCGQTEEKPAVSSDHEEWTELFNGENLDGWNIKIRGSELNADPRETFRVEDGLLKVRYDNYGEYDQVFGHIFYEKPYSYYRLQVNYRFTGSQIEGGPDWAWRNNGIMFHSQPAQTVQRDQDFPNSIEFQLLGGDGENDRSNGNVCTPGTHIVLDGALITNHCTSSNGPTHHGDQWVTAELVAYGDSLIQNKLNGEIVMEYTEPQLDDGTLLERGYIALQSESHPTDFRSVRILNLKGCMDADATNYKTYYIKDNPDSCTYPD
jgi:hypothetical protein